LIGRFGRRGAAVILSIALAAGVARAELRVTGVDDDVEEVVRAFLTVDDLPCDSPRWWIERAFRRADMEARQAMETLGYYQSSVEISLAWDQQCWQVRVAIVRGEAVRIGTVDIVVQPPLDTEPRMREVLDAQPIAAGGRFSHREYEAAKARLMEVAEDLGYFDARYTRHVVKVDPQANLAAVELTLDSGQRYRIGAINIDQVSLRPELFRRFLHFEEGQPFDARQLATTFRDLLSSQYFDRVLVAPDLDAREDQTVPVLVTASALTRRSLLLGAGYATDTGPRARGDLRYRRLNDRGHRASVSTVVSSIQGEVKGQYRLPYGDPAHEWLFAESALSYEDTDTYESLRRTLGVGRTHLRGMHWTETNYLDLRIDDFEVGEQDGRSRLLLLGSSWSRKTLVEDPRPLSGHALSLDVRGAARQLLSDNDLLQLIVRARHIQPLGDRLRVLSRISGGWTLQQDFDNLPPSIRFFAGGDNSVRGYGFETIGPEEDGNVVGGKGLLTGSVELDLLFRSNWSFAVFTDAGSAFNDRPDFSRSVGVGVRWYSPLGPLRLDLAHPLDDPDRSVRIHISLGPDL